MKSATMNGENVLNVLQSREAFGLKKLNAKRMKMAELMMTSHHNPYDGTS